MFNFVRKSAVGSYGKELKEFTDWLLGLDNEGVADVFILSVWTRAGMQCEGHFNLPDGYKINTAQLTAYPIMLSQFKKIIKAFEKQGLKTEGYVLYVWVHTLRGFLYGEPLESELSRMWNKILSSQTYWAKYLQRLYEDDKKNQMDPILLENTLGLAKEILNDLPPSKHS